jgi:hypothetical protein
VGDFEKVLKLANDEKVIFGCNLKDLLHKKLTLGQTRYVCRYGTLSEGHEKITDSQRYFQAIKEMWYLANNMQTQKAHAMVAQADLMDAEEAVATLSKDGKPSDLIRAESALLMAQTKLTNALVTIEDQTRCLDEYNKIRLELEPIVEAQYPEGIEQAEHDNWRAVAQYRLTKNPMSQLDNIPLPALEKAQFGELYGRPDAAAWYLTHAQQKLQLENKEHK